MSRKDLPTELYDARDLDAENRAYDDLSRAVEAQGGWMRAQGWPKDGRGAAFLFSVICYPGQPGPVNAAEAWASGGGSSVRGRVRAYVNDPAMIADLRRRGEDVLYRRAVRP